MNLKFEELEVMESPISSYTGGWMAGSSLVVGVAIGALIGLT